MDKEKSDVILQKIIDHIIPLNINLNKDDHNYVRMFCSNNGYICLFIFIDDGCMLC